MIKGPLGLMVWTDTLNDDLAIKPTDLVMLEAKNREVDTASAVKEETIIVSDLQAA